MSRARRGSHRADAGSLVFLSVFFARPIGWLAFLVFALALAALNGCARVPGIAPSPAAVAAPAQSALTVFVPGDAAHALERTKAAFVAAGLTIADASSGGTVTSAPVVLNPGASFPSNVVYRAVVIAAGDSARVVLTGDTGAEPGHGAPADRTPLTSHQASAQTPHGAEGWAKLVALAADISGAR